MPDNSPEATQDTPNDIKLKNHLEKFQGILAAVNDSQFIGFRLIALIFVIAVEAFFFVAVFQGKKVDAGVVTAMTILAVLPILIMRAFDITALSLTREGITSAMGQSDKPKIVSLTTDNPTNGKALPIKFGSVVTGTAVTVKTDKFFQIECDGIPYKLAIVE